MIRIFAQYRRKKRHIVAIFAVHIIYSMAIYISRGEIMAVKSIKRDINDVSTWAYPNIPSGVTVLRKEDVTEAEIYGIYRDCINIQRSAYLRLIKEQGHELPPVDEKVLAAH